MRQTTRTITGATALVVAALTLAGCGQATEAAPTATASPVPLVTLSAEEQAVADAKEAYVRAVKVDEEISTNLTNSLEGYDAVMTGPALIEAKNDTEQQRKQSIYFTGATKIVSMEPITVVTEYDPNADPPKVPLVSLKVCLDLSEVKIHEESTGKSESLVKPRQEALVDVTNETGLLTDKGSWRVSYAKNEGSSC